MEGEPTASGYCNLKKLRLENDSQSFKNQNITWFNRIGTVENVYKRLQSAI